MAKKKIGLALGAGSARGLAHIGVLQVFEEYGIKFDYIVGTSIGSVAGAIYSCGCDLEMVKNFSVQMDEKIFLDYKIPKNGLIAGEKFEELVRLFTKGKSFEEIDQKFACVACNIANAKSEMLQTGPIYKSVRCSISIPGIFEPATLNGVTYIDGAVIDRVPVEQCLELGADIVIGVDVGYKGEENKPHKNIIDVLMSTFDIMGWEIAKNKISKADFMLMPKLNEINPYKTAQAKQCIEIGEACARESIDDILKLIKQ